MASRLSVSQSKWSLTFLLLLLLLFSSSFLSACSSVCAKFVSYFETSNEYQCICVLVANAIRLCYENTAQWLNTLLFYFILFDFFSAQISKNNCYWTHSWFALPNFHIPHNPEIVALKFHLPTDDFTFFWFEKKNANE